MNKDVIDNYNYDKLSERLKSVDLSKYYYHGNLLTQSVKIFYILLNSKVDNKEDLSKIKNVYGLTVGEINNVLRAGMIDKIFTKEEIKHVLIICKRYASIYGKCRKNSEKKDLKCITIIKEFMDGKYISIDSFCKDKDITFNTFKQLVKSSKVIDNDLYKTFIKYLKYVQHDNFMEIDKMWDKIKEKLLNDSNEENNHKFDLIDYYEITNLLPMELYHVLGKRIGYEDEALALFKTFCNNTNANIILKSADIDKICNSNYIFTIKNKKIVLTAEEKQAVRDYFVRNNIPFSEKMFILGLRRYLEGSLNLEKTVVKKRVFKR